jgi:hypothetical protein
MTCASSVTARATVGGNPPSFSLSSYSAGLTCLNTAFTPKASKRNPQSANIHEIVRQHTISPDFQFLLLCEMFRD